MARRRLIVSVVGTRPNFMKIAPVVVALAERPDHFEHLLVHTGQHYDRMMSDAFLEDLGLGQPDHSLAVGSGSHAQQIARVMERLEAVLVERRPDLLLVPGDVNSTMAAAIVGAKLGIRVGHVEAGLRSFDRTMPEEINRVVTDQLSDLLFTHSPEAEGNLIAEGRPSEAIHYVGNTMVDTLLAMRERFREIDAPASFGVEPNGYLVVTLHRPALVDGHLLGPVLRELQTLSNELPVLFPVHPRTRAAMQTKGLGHDLGGLRLLEPLGYLEFLSLVEKAAAVLTDSGGIQEETTCLGIPCFTLRANTERPVTCEIGSNTLLGLAPERIAEIPNRLAHQPRRPPAIPPLWDGRAAGRIVDVIAADEDGQFVR